MSIITAVEFVVGAVVMIALLRVVYRSSGPAQGIAAVTSPEHPDSSPLLCEAVEHFDLVAHLRHQKAFSERTWGPADGTAGVIDHIRKELTEIEADPADVIEWVDVILLSLDGAWRAGYSPEQVCAAIARKQAVNESRRWPDWRTQPRDRALEHDRSDD